MMRSMALTPRTTLLIRFPYKYSVSATQEEPSSVFFFLSFDQAQQAAANS
jgi:hypothetical protein